MKTVHLLAFIAACALAVPAYAQNASANGPADSTSTANPLGIGQANL